MHHINVSAYKKAAGYGFVQAQYRLATMYYQGLGVTKDLAAARSWYKRSSDNGHAPSQKRFGMMIATGEGGARSFLQGFALV